MMHTMAQWNWGGLAFVGGMFVLVALSGWATERLRQWAETAEAEKAEKARRGIYFNRLFIQWLYTHTNKLMIRTNMDLPERSAQTFRDFMNVPLPANLTQQKDRGQDVTPILFSDAELRVMRSATERKQ